MNGVIVFAFDHQDGLTTRDLFREVKNKPLIAWVLETLEHSEKVDIVEVVAPQSLEQEMAGLFESYALQKPQVIVPPGETLEECFLNGLLGVSDMLDHDDTVTFVDATMPMFNEDIINTCIERTLEKHTVLADPNNDGTAETVADSTMFENYPQGYIFGEVTDAYMRASEDNPEEGRFNTPVTLCLLYGKIFYTTKSSKESQIELKSVDDFKLFEDYLDRQTR